MVSCGSQRNMIGYQVSAAIFLKTLPISSGTILVLAHFAVFSREKQAVILKEMGQSLRGPLNYTKMEEIQTKSEFLSCPNMAGTNPDTLYLPSYFILSIILYGLYY